MVVKISRKLIILWIVLFIITILLATLYANYTSEAVDQYRVDIKNIDEEEMPRRPFTYIESISSSNIKSVSDLYTPKFFDNDNISLSFPENESYGYMIGIRPEDPGGSLTIYRSNGSQIAYSRWMEGKGSLGGAHYSQIRKFEGGDSLTLNLSGSGIIVFISESTSKMFMNSTDFSGMIADKIVTFYIPPYLTDNLPSNKRIVSEISLVDEGYYKVKYYSEGLHFLVEAEGTEKNQVHIPSGQSFIVIAVVETSGNVSFQFGYSSPYPSEGDTIKTFLCGSLLLSSVLLIIIGVIMARHFWKAKALHRKAKLNNIVKKDKIIAFIIITMVTIGLCYIIYDVYRMWIEYYAVWVMIIALFAILIDIFIIIMVFYIMRWWQNKYAIKKDTDDGVNSK